jgi:hypothetical protein
MAKKDDTSDTQQIVAHLRAAAAHLPEGADLELFEAYAGEAMVDQAWEELQRVAQDHSVPFGFWVELSKAGDLLGRD